MPDQTARGSKGLMESLTTMAATLVAMAHTRLGLLSVDLEEEREHWLSLMVLVLIVLFCLGLGVILITALIVVAFWDTHRFLVLGTLGGAFLVVGFAVLGLVIQKARTKPKLFAASLSELRKDREQLVSKS